MITIIINVSSTVNSTSTRHFTNLAQAQYSEVQTACAVEHNTAVQMVKT